jgi:hypothetical protein
MKWRSKSLATVLTLCLPETPGALIVLNVIGPDLGSAIIFKFWDILGLFQVWRWINLFIDHVCFPIAAYFFESVRRVQ